MANKAIDALVYCPFYICEARTTITCEGLISDKTVSHFESEREKKEHQENFCMGKCCRGCPIYGALAAKYQ